MYMSTTTWLFDFNAWHAMDGWDTDGRGLMGQHGWTHEMIFL